MEQFERQKSSAVIAVEAALKLEKDPLFTQNTHYLDSCRKKWLLHYRTIRRYPTPYYISPEEDSPRPIVNNPLMSPAPIRYVYPSSERASPCPSPTTRALSALEELGFKDLTANDLARLTQYDSFDDEVNVMAEVRAYFQVAYKVLHKLHGTISGVLTLHFLCLLSAS